MHVNYLYGLLIFSSAYVIDFYSQLYLSNYIILKKKFLKETEIIDNLVLK
jgi:hypothetical protein